MCALATVIHDHACTAADRCMLVGAVPLLRMISVHTSLCMASHCSAMARIAPRMPVQQCRCVQSLPGDGWVSLSFRLWFLRRADWIVLFSSVCSLRLLADGRRRRCSRRRRSQSCSAKAAIGTNAFFTVWALASRCAYSYRDCGVGDGMLREGKWKRASEYVYWSRSSFTSVLSTAYP